MNSKLGTNGWEVQEINNSNPANGVFAVTPSDTVELAIYTRSIRATNAGNVKLTGADGGS